MGNERVQNVPLNGSASTTVATLSGRQRRNYFYVDNNDNIYLSETFNHSVWLFPANSTNGTRVAGITDVAGGSNGHLNAPLGVFVKHDEAIYIADYKNHRIMKWLSGTLSGTIAAGDGTPGTSSTQLNGPTQIIVDTNEYMYISEVGNNRIMRWRLNSSCGVCIIGCKGTHGTESTQLNEPYFFAFDSNGSLYVSDMGDHRIKKFQILNYSISYNQPTICPNLTWDKYGITFANNNVVGWNPRGIFIDYKDNIYVANHIHKRILVWSKESKEPVRNLSAKLYEYTNLFVTMNGDIYFENGNETGRIDKWTMNSNTSVFVTKSIGHCDGLFVDIHNILYCSLRSQHQVAKISLNGSDSNVSIVAGTGYLGNASNELSQPWGIFVDRSFNLYVADHMNDRIQLFYPGQTNGKTVVGNGIPNNLKLKSPTDIILDADDNLYIVDNNNHRIIRVGHNEYQCIAGCTCNKGSKSDELNKPYAIRFDSIGNLYVTDEANNRIQKFILSKNSSGTSEINSSTIKNITAISFSCQNQNQLITTEPTIAVSTRQTTVISIESTIATSIEPTSTTSSKKSTTLPTISSYQTTVTSIGPISTATGPSTPISTQETVATSIDQTTVTSIGPISTSTEPSTAISTQQTIGTSTEPSTAITTQQTVATSTEPIPQLQSLYFRPPTCSSSTNIGFTCSFPGTVCDMLQPCENNGTCNTNDNNQGYNCSCLAGFNGTRCQFDHRPCKENTCWNNGTCNTTSDTTFNCICEPVWEGDHCERKINYCHNITCENKGVCRPLLGNYTCECLSGSYSGLHCEIVATKIKIYKIVSTSFAYIAIIAMVSVAMFVIIMDVLKYCFGIDPTREELERIRREKQAKKRKPIIQRFVYVNAPSSEQTISTIDDTTV